MLTFFRSKSNPQKIAAEKLYSGLVAQSRTPVFYAEWAVPDSVDGRFDMILLHAFVVMRRLGTGGVQDKELSQALYDVMFVDMDRAIREIGIGDLSVKKHIRRMMKAFNGRMDAYEKGLTDPVALNDALRRNLYGTVKSDIQIDTAPMAGYLKTAVASVDAMPLQAIHDGNVIWPMLAAQKSA